MWGVVARLDPTTKMIAEGLAETLRYEPVVLEAAQGRQELMRRTKRFSHLQRLCALRCLRKRTMVSERVRASVQFENI